MSVTGKLSVFLALWFASTTILFFNYFPRYLVVSDNLIKNPDFSPDHKDWQTGSRGTVFAGNGLVGLTVEPGAPSVTIGQTINLPPLSLLQLTCDFKVEGVVNGVNSWDTARVVLISLDDDGKALYDRPHLVVQQSGGSEWSPASAVFMTDGDVAKVEVALQLMASQGSMYVKSIGLHKITVNPEFTCIRQWLLIVWLVCGFLAAARLLQRHIKNRQQALAGLVLLLIWAGILLPASIKYRIAHSTVSGDSAAAYHPGFTGPDLQKFSFILSAPEWDIFKIGHLVLFGVLACLLASRNTYNLNPLRNIGMLSVLASLTEVAQLFIPGRTPTVMDIFIDLSGALLGLMIKAGWAACRPRRTQLEEL